MNFQGTKIPETEKKMSDNVKEVSDADFESTIASDTPCLVDFWAPWCGPCKAIGPVIDELADTYSGKIKITKIRISPIPIFQGTLTHSGSSLKY